VTIGSLPVASTSDVALTVEPENIHDVYDRYNSIIENGTEQHIANTHGDRLVVEPTLTASGSNMNVVITNAAADIGGLRIPSSGTTGSTVTLDHIDGNAASLSSSEAKVDAITLDAGGNLLVSRGVKFTKTYGITTRASVPASQVLVGYVYVDGSLAVVRQHDILTGQESMDWGFVSDALTDADGRLGTSITKKLDVAISQPRLIPGLTLSLERLRKFQQPTLVTGVVLSAFNDTSASHPEF